MNVDCQHPRLAGPHTQIAILFSSLPRAETSKHLGFLLGDSGGKGGETEQTDREHAAA